MATAPGTGKLSAGQALSADWSGPTLGEPAPARGPVVGIEGLMNGVHVPKIGETGGEKA